MASIGGLISAMYDARNEVEGKCRCRCRCRCRWRSATRPRTREGIRDQSLRDQTDESDQEEQGEQGEQHIGTRTWLRAASDCNHPDYLVSCCRAVPVASAGAGAGAREGMASITSESQSSAYHWMACRHCSCILADRVLDRAWSSALASCRPIEYFPSFTARPSTLHACMMGQCLTACSAVWSCHSWTLV